MCATWRADFAAFLADMGERPAGTKLGRVDPAAGFTVDNCRWIELESRSRRAKAGRKQPQRSAICGTAVDRQRSTPPGAVPSLQ